MYHQSWENLTLLHLQMREPSPKWHFSDNNDNIKSIHFIKHRFFLLACQVKLHNRKLKVCQCVQPREAHLVRDEKWLCYGHCPCCTREEVFLYGVEEPAEADNIQFGARFLEDGSCSINREQKYKVSFRDLDGKSLFFPMEGDPSYHTLLYDPNAAPGSEWQTCDGKPSGLCLCSMIIKA